MFSSFRKILYERHPAGSRTTISLALVFPLVVLCGLLGVLQYRWIGEVSISEQAQLRANLQLSLDRLREDFDMELARDCRAIAGFDGPAGVTLPEQGIKLRYAKWRSTTSHQGVFRRIAVASHEGNELVLQSLNPDTGDFVRQPWPSEWAYLRREIESGIPARFPGGRRFDFEYAATPVLGVPLVFLPAPGSFPPDPMALRSSMNWIIFDFNQPWLLGNLLPELVQIHLRVGGRLDYLIQVVERGPRRSVVFESNPDHAANIVSKADASVSLFNLTPDQLIRPLNTPDTARFSARSLSADLGRWDMFVRHQSGSLDVVVASARRRNMAVTAGVLLLMALSAAALVYFSRRAQQLAELQMNFVTGVSHELRTPLAVIQLAGHNLETKVNSNPVQVAEYGILIQQESRRLRELVDQVLRFASSKAGRTIRERKPLSIADVIDQALDSGWTDRPRTQYTIDKRIDADLPLVIGDRLALEHAFQNLLNNAARHAMKVNPWVAVSVSKTTTSGEIEIRITDRGPGIPAQERHRIFDPFFRGQRAIDQQVHGTGLGLSLVREIVEAHGGTIAISDAPADGTQFIIRLPAAPNGEQHVLTDSLSRG
jgi:signal transduction histidine kinase